MTEHKQKEEGIFLLQNDQQHVTGHKQKEEGIFWERNDQQH